MQLAVVFISVKIINKKNAIIFGLPVMRAVSFKYFLANKIEMAWCARARGRCRSSFRNDGERVSWRNAAKEMPMCLWKPCQMKWNARNSTTNWIPFLTPSFISVLSPLTWWYPFPILFKTSPLERLIEFSIHSRALSLLFKK